MALTDGDPVRLGDYWLAGRLGEGGQGVVYEGYDEEGGRVAIKVLRGDGSLRGGLEREAAAARRVASFCTARVLDADLDGPVPYIVSEYVEGPSLRAAGRVFGGDDLHRLAAAVATALTAIHEAGVVHRDLKPDNVLLGPDGPRVIDFGVARTLDMPLTSTGVVAGTPSYMAPELFTGHRAGAPADVFAWGAIMVFAATGEDPFRAESMGAVMHRVLAHDPLLDALPEPLRALVAAALAKDPRDRPAARDLLLALAGAAPPPAALALSPTDGGDPALGTIAEDAYAALGPAERALVPEIMLRLITVTDQGDLVVRQAGRAELLDGRTAEETAMIDRVLGAFAYLVSGGDPIRLTRPALPMAWPRLRAWIQANRDGLAVHRQIWTAAGRWSAGGRSDGDLFQGAALDQALHWAAAERRHITLTPTERDFLDQGAALTRRKARRTRLLSVTLGAALTVALIAGGLAVQQSRTIAEQRDVAESRRVAALAGEVRDRDPVLGMLLAVAATRVAVTPEARDAMSAGLTHPGVAAFRDPSPQAVRGLSADGRTLYSAGGGQVRIWDVRTGRSTAVLTDPSLTRVFAVAASPAGRTLAVATADGIKLWDLRTNTPLKAAYPLYRDAGDFDFGLSYGRSEDVLIVALGQGTTLWNVRTGARTSVPTLGWPADVTPDGRAAVYAFMKPVYRQPLPRGERTTLRKSCSQCYAGLELSPDGTRVATVEDGQIEVRDALTGKGEDRVVGPWNGGRLGWSPDGRLIASVSDDDVQVWRLDSEENGPDFETNVIPGTGPALFDPDGHTLRYLAGDTVVAFDLRTSPGVGLRSDASALSPDGRLLAAHASPGTVHLWAIGKAAPVSLPIGPTDTSLPSMVFSPDGGLLAVHNDAPAVLVFDTATGAKTATFAVGGEAMAFSPDGTRLATAGQTAENRSTVRLWDLRTGRTLWTWNHEEVVEALAFTPDGATVTADRHRQIDAATGRSVRRPLPAFSAEGVFHGGQDTAGRLTTWRPGTAGPEDRAFQDLPSGIAHLAYSADGSLAAVAAGEGAVSVYDVATGRRVARPAAGPFTAVAFDAEGRLLTLGEDHLLRIHALDAGLVADAVCTRAGRSLTAAEWGEHLRGLPYREVCGR
ncbi:protein kinase [Nonomuraea sp. NPDC046570]|uniref:protein kinase domain-containing protein n=1 Tax=Nonomuraea sp. NPDC046570 TaxID=3155255 RepID=UPI0033D041B5